MNPLDLKLSLVVSVSILLSSLLPESDPNSKLAPIDPNQFYSPPCLSSKPLPIPLHRSIPSAWILIPYFSAW